MAALQIKNLPTGNGDDIKFDITYAAGDTKNVISTSSTSPNFLMLGGTQGQLGPRQSIAFGATTDAVYLPVAAGGDGNLHLTTSYGIRGAFLHNWDPYWSSSVFGGMGWVKYSGTVGDLTSARGEYCATYAATVAGQGVTYSCNPNYTISMLGSALRWIPIKGLEFSAEAIWTHLSTGFTGTAKFSPAAPYPVAALAFRSQDTISLNLRAARAF
jgi:hypothetical protein